MMGVSYNSNKSVMNAGLVGNGQLTGSLNITGKSKRGKSMYKNKLSDFWVSAWLGKRNRFIKKKICIKDRLHNAQHGSLPFFGTPACLTSPTLVNLHAHVSLQAKEESAPFPYFSSFI
jgi:hypothetical protein